MHYGLLTSVLNKANLAIKGVNLLRGTALSLRKPKHRDPTIIITPEIYRTDA